MASASAGAICVYKRLNRVLSPPPIGVEFELMGVFAVSLSSDVKRVTQGYRRITLRIRFAQCGKFARLELE